MRAPIELCQSAFYLISTAQHEAHFVGIKYGVHNSYDHKTIMFGRFETHSRNDSVTKVAGGVRKASLIRSPKSLLKYVRVIRLNPVEIRESIL